MIAQTEPSRYESMIYRRCGRSGLVLPVLSLGLWQNFGDDRAVETQRAVLRTAFDLGITHFDLANNYGPPPGSAESSFGRILRTDFRAHRDELIISTKAGYDMWSGPYGSGGARKHLLSSLDQSLSRLGVEYVDVFYSHCFDPHTPLDETMSALHSAVQQGKALYAGISSYSAERTRDAARILGDLGTPLLIHQPSYSMFNRWIEQGLLDTLEKIGTGCIAFSPLAQGLLTDRYLGGIPEGSRMARQTSLRREMLTTEAVEHLGALNRIASRRGQTLAQLALAWCLRDERVTSVLIGASSVDQIRQNVAATENLELDVEELSEIESHAVEMDINLWKGSSTWLLEPIVTDRLVLRLPHADDGDFYAALAGSPDVRRHLGGPLDQDHAEEAAREAITISPWGHFVIEETASRSPVGTCVLGRDRGELELSYQLLPDYWGNGFAFEAAAACLDWVAGNSHDRQIIAVTQSSNDRSLRLLARLGFHEQERIIEFGEEQSVLRRPLSRVECPEDAVASD